MRLENVWKWLDAVDQGNLDPLDQWGVSPLRQPSQIETLGTTTVSRDTDRSPSQLLPTPPSGILLRNGSVRLTRQKTKTTAPKDEKNTYPKSRGSGSPTSVTQDQTNGNVARLPVSSITTGPEPTDQRAGESTCQPQTSRAEGNKDPIGVKRLPTFRERARLHNLPGISQPTPVIQVEVTDPVAVNCQGAKVVGDRRHNGIRRLVDMTRTSRRHTVDGDLKLHRSNALRRPSNVRAESKQLRNIDKLDSGPTNFA